MRGRRTGRAKKSMVHFYVFVAIAAIAVAAASFFYFHDTGGGMEIFEDSHQKPTSVKTIMVMGIDPREGDKGRSDTLMIGVVDTKAKSASVISVPRDTRVKIEGNGFDKINHAYAFGDEQLTKKTVEALLGIPMDHYVMIDVRAFERIIDALDGIDIDVEKRMYYEDPWDDDGGLVIDLYPGMQHLDGEDAMGYVRYRDEEGDIGRIRRQQKFMKALIEKAVSPDVLPKLPKLMKEVASLISTDMSVSDMMHMAAFLPDIQQKGVDGSMLEGKPAWWKGANYWIPDVMKAREKFFTMVQAKWDDKAQAEAQKLALEYEESMPTGLIDVNGTLVMPDEVDEFASGAAQKSEREEEAGKKDKSDKKDQSDKEDKSQDDDKDKSKKDGDKDKKKKAEEIKSPSDIDVRVRNCSGIDGAGARVADALRSKGFNVIDVGNGKTSDQQHTEISAPAGGVDFFYGMPFDCVIVANESDDEAVVSIGKDFGK